MVMSVTTTINKGRFIIGVWHRLITMSSIEGYSSENLRILSTVPKIPRTPFPFNHMTGRTTEGGWKTES